MVPFDSLNLGDHVQDDPQHVQTNRWRLQQHCDARPVFLQQVHGTDVVALDAATPDGVTADACWTDQLGVACTIMVADCLPLLFTDVQGRAVAAAHAGWRGLAAGVIEATLARLQAAAGCDVASVQVWLGPCIGPIAFEVGDDVRQAFGTQDAAMATFFRPGAQAGKWFADLAGLARLRLRQAGLVQVFGNDGGSDWCTVTQSSRFFSYRRDGRSGRFAACIWRSA